jgi:phosphoglycerate dehydrogenase-like enzyme
VLASLHDMRVLLTEIAHGRYWSRLGRPGVEPLLLSTDGGFGLEDGSTVERDAGDPEVAWGTSDLYQDGGPLRPFFGALRRSPTLRWFQSPGAGFDDPVFRELAERGVQVTNAHVNSVPIAEYVLRAVLDHFQRAELWRQAQAHREWRLHDYRELYGSTWLIVGLGSIGSAVATRAGAFGVRTIGCRRHPTSDEVTDSIIGPDQLPDTIPTADVVVLSASANASTNGLMDERLLGAMKPGSVLVNVARGGLVDEKALLAALDRGIPEAAILDVFAVEPLPADSPLWRHPSVMITPHNSAGGVGRYERQAELFAENLGRYLAGRALLNNVTAAITAA